MQVEDETEEWYGMYSYEYTRSKVILKIVYFVNSKGIGRSEWLIIPFPSMSIHSALQRDSGPLRPHSILRNKAIKQGYFF